MLCERLSETMSDNVQVAFVTGLFGILGIVITYFLGHKTKKSKTNSPSLKNHHIFSRIDLLRGYIATGFCLPNKGKEKVFKDMLLNYIRIWGNELCNLADKLDAMNENVSQTEFQTVVVKSFTVGNETFKTYFKSGQYTVEEQECLSLVMSKFNNWNSKRIKLLGDSLISVCNSQFYTTKTIRSAVILDLYVQLFIDMVSDAEQTINSVNGDLKGSRFKGTII